MPRWHYAAHSTYLPPRRRRTHYPWILSRKQLRDAGLSVRRGRKGFDKGIKRNGIRGPRFSQTFRNSQQPLLPSHVRRPCNIAGSSRENRSAFCPFTKLEEISIGELVFHNAFWCAFDGSEIMFCSWTTVQPFVCGGCFQAISKGFLTWIVYLICRCHKARLHTTLTAHFLFFPKLWNWKSRRSCWGLRNILARLPKTEEGVRFEQRSSGVSCLKRKSWKKREYAAGVFLVPWKKWIEAHPR